MIQTLTTFQSGSLKIPNATAAPNSSDYTGDLQEFINRYEQELLIDGLGVPLYNTLTTEYADFVNASQPIKDLVSGKEYVLNGVTVKWGGLLDRSFLAYYIYYQFLQEKQDVFTTMGVERPEAVNSNANSPIERAVRAHREFIKGYQGGNDLPTIVHTSFGSGLDWLASQSTQRSLYQYLVDNVIDYPTAENFTFHELSNTFGL